MLVRLRQVPEEQQSMSPKKNAVKEINLSNLGIERQLRATLLLTDVQQRPLKTTKDLFFHIALHSKTTVAENCHLLHDTNGVFREPEFTPISGKCSAPPKNGFLN